MVERLPYMPLFVGDYLSSMNVQLMSLAERGLYCHLLFLMWQEGPLPFDLDKLARLAQADVDEVRRLWPQVERMFKTDEQGRLYNEKLEEIRSVSIDQHRRRVEAGRKGGLISRRGPTPDKQCLSNAKAMLKPGLSNAQATITITKDINNLPRAREAGVSKVDPEWFANLRDQIREALAAHPEGERAKVLKQHSVELNDDAQRVWLTSEELEASMNAGWLYRTATRILGGKPRAFK